MDPIPTSGLCEEGRSRRRFMLGAAAATVGLFLAACGNNGNDDVVTTSTIPVNTLQPTPDMTSAANAFATLGADTLATPGPDNSVPEIVKSVTIYTDSSYVYTYKCIFPTRTEDVYLYNTVLGVGPNGVRLTGQDQLLTQGDEIIRDLSCSGDEDPHRRAIGVIEAIGSDSITIGQYARPLRR